MSLSSLSKICFQQCLALAAFPPPILLVPNRISQILGSKVREGNLSPAAIDQVKEFALLQKVYIVMRLGKILGLSELDYDAQLIHSIPNSYRDGQKVEP